MALVYLVAVVAACAGLLFGYDTGAILLIRMDFKLSPILVGVVTSVALAGATPGSAAGGWLADRFGNGTSSSQRPCCSPVALAANP